MGDRIISHEMIAPKGSSDLYADTADPLLSAAFPEYSNFPALSDSCSPLLTMSALRERERDLGVVYPTFYYVTTPTEFLVIYLFSLVEQIEFDSRLYSHNPDFVSSPAVFCF